MPNEQSEEVLRSADDSHDSNSCAVTACHQGEDYADLTIRNDDSNDAQVRVYFLAD